MPVLQVQVRASHGYTYGCSTDTGVPGLQLQALNGYGFERCRTVPINTFVWNFALRHVHTYERRVPCQFVNCCLLETWIFL